MTAKSSREAAVASSTSGTASGGLKLSNLTPPGSRKYGTYAMGGNYERSDGSSQSSQSVKTPPVARKVGRASPTNNLYFSAGKMIKMLIRENHRGSRLLTDPSRACSQPTARRPSWRNFHLKLDMPTKRTPRRLDTMPCLFMINTENQPARK